MAGITRRAGVRRALIAVAPAALAAGLLPAQTQTPHDSQFPIPGVREDTKLPNGKSQRDEILKAEYEQNVKEKSDRFVLSVGLLKKLDDMEKLTRKIRGRMKK